MRTSEVKPGMKGYGLTVFAGTKIERFDVEVISVLKNSMGPKQDVVLIRCFGQRMEHSGPVQGMSGSPIFLIDEHKRERMIGAFALGWEYSKDSVAGVRPIEEMLRVPSEAREIDAAPAHAQAMWDARAFVASIGKLPATPLANDVNNDAKTNANPLRPMVVPVLVGGVNQAFVDAMQPFAHAAGIATLAAAGNADAPENVGAVKLEPGSAIGVPVVRGDLDLAAIGTVTEVIGDNVFAFGHSFLDEGPTRFPMGVGYIHTIIASQAISFKLGSLLHIDGAINSDEPTAIAGRIGAAPAMIPINIEVTLPQRDGVQKYAYEVVQHPRFTPFGTMIAINSALTGHGQLPAEFTVDYALKYEFAGGRVMDISNTTSSLLQGLEMARDVQLPVALALGNPFEKVYPTRITAAMTVRPRIELDIIETVRPARTVYKPGETVSLFVSTRAWKGNPRTQAVAFKLPDDLPDGPVQIITADAARFVEDETRFAPQLFQATKIDDVFALTRTLTNASTRTLYVRLVTRREVVSAGRLALDHLPVSKRRVLGQPGRNDVQVYPETLVRQTPWDMPISGAVETEILIARDPDKVKRPPANAPSQPPASPRNASPG